MKQRKESFKRVLAILLAMVMVFTSMPVSIFASGTDVPVNNNVIDISDNKFASISKYHATVTGLEISDAEVTSATEDGQNVYITLSGTTSADAVITATFQCTTNSFTVTQSANTITLENGEANASIKLIGKYMGRLEKGNYTYNLYFTTAAALTEVPERIKDSDTAEVYEGNAITFGLKDYFKNATEYYLVENGQKTKLENKNYTFTAETEGTYTLTFAAANAIGTCEDYATVTVLVKKITSGIYINKVSSNGSLNYITFTDTDGNGIEGVSCTTDGTNIKVTLPKTYNPTGKVRANFNLTQNGAYPFITTNNAFNRAEGAKTTQVTSTLSGGSAKATVYYYIQAPKATSNVYDTYTIEYVIKNEIPILADSENSGENATLSAGETFELNLSDLFADADGDALTYHVSINGESKVAADAAYTFTTNTAGSYKLIFTAHDGKSESTDTYTVTLTVENVDAKDSMMVKLPAGLNPAFHVTNGFADGTDVLGDALAATKTVTTDGFDTYKVEYPQNAEYISVRTADWGGVAFETEKDGAISFSKVTLKTTDLAEIQLDASVSVKYGEQTAIAGTKGYLLKANQSYSFTATPKDTDYVTKTENVMVAESEEIVMISIAMGYKSPKTITVPTGATAQLFAYNKYYDFTEIPVKAAVDNGDGTTTFYFITTKSPLSYRASMEGKVTEAGYWMRNMTIDFDDGKNSPKTNASILDNSVLVNVNSQNHLKLKEGDSYKLKGYRAWEIIKFSYQNEIITPDFNYKILSGNDVVSLTPEKSKSNGGSGQHSDWMRVTALKKGTAVIEVTYDAIDVVEGSWPGLYPASDEKRSGLIFVTVGGEDHSVDFGIKGFASQGGMTYKESNKKAWDAEFDTLYFTGDSGRLKLKPTASSTVKEVAVSHDKGSSWDKIKSNGGTYAADIKVGNNVIRVTTENGVAYQIVRGSKVTVAPKEIVGASDGDGLIEAGEGVRITIDGLYTPIPKISGNYNPGYKANLEGDSGVHMVYNFQGSELHAASVQYTFGAEGNNIEVTIPEDYDEKTISLTDGYIALGVLGLKAFADDGDSHRNIPDAGCATRDSETTFHTRSMLPEITLTIGGEAAPNTAPIVKADAVSSAEITLGQNYAINPELLFTDKDGDTLTYQVSVDGKAAETITAAYQFTPAETGSYQLTFTAGDGEATVSHTVTLIVKEKPADEDKPDGLIFDLTEDEIDGYVTVSFEDNGVREPGATGLKFPVPLGIIIEPVKVPYKNGDSVAAVTVRLLKAMDVEYTHSGTVESSFYLSSIKNFVVNHTPYDEMGEFHAGSGSGWMITLNDVFINKGASDFDVKNNDEVRWQYSCQLGADIGDNYAENLISNVEDLIDAIGTVTEDSEDVIKAARQAYDKLNPMQQKAVENYEKLVAAEKELAELLATSKDHKAASKVEALIDTIGTVTLDDEKKIEKARQAYEQLTDVQKQLVDNYDTLVKAENMLNHLKNPSHEKVYKQTGDYIESLGTPYSGSIGGDWMALGLARSGRKVSKEYFDNVVKTVRENINEEGQLHWYKSTENSRVILGLTATSYDPTDVDGHNLLTALTDMEYVTRQGINGAFWALIAFDSHDYKIPKGGDATREKLIQTILNAQLEDGGWTLSGSISDSDMTGMALQALAPYYETNSKVKVAVDKALNYLSKTQNADGSFTGIDGVNTESMAQIIVALTALGINPETDSRFVKNGLSVIDALCNFAVDGGGFRHTLEGNLDGMATEQGYYALTAYMRFLKGETSLFDMSDVGLETGDSPEDEDFIDHNEDKEDGLKDDAEVLPTDKEDGPKDDAEVLLTDKEEGTKDDAEVLPADKEEGTKDDADVLPVDKEEEKTKAPMLSEKEPTVKKPEKVATFDEKTLQSEENNKQSEAKGASEVNTDAETGIVVLNIGKNIRVIVNKITDKEIIQKLIHQFNGGKLLGLWDISLVDILTGEEHIPSEPVTVKIPLKLLGEYTAYKQIAVVHVTDDGKLEFLQSDIEGEYLVFDTIEFSHYGVVGLDEELAIDDLPLDGDNGKSELPWLPWTIAGGCSILLLGVLFIALKRK